MAVTQLSSGNDDGTTLGQSATDKVGFYGVTPVVQPATAAAALVDSSGGTASTVFTLTTITGTYNQAIVAANFATLAAAVASIRTALRDLGLSA